jgi:divalent metal cation (Fe/Co/Zn/Cd) transporter
MMPDIAIHRDALVRRGRRIEYFTIGWNSMEALFSVAAALMAGSVALMGFGLDSLIEVVSGGAVLWRLHHDPDPARRQQAERTSLRLVGLCFIALASYIVYQSGSVLVRHKAPEPSMLGIVIAAAALVVMPILARAKRRVAGGIASGAMHADSRQTDFCAYLSAMVLGGLLVNALFGWWWADPVAGLLMVPIMAKEGIDALKGKACCGDCGCATL